MNNQANMVIKSLKTLDVSEIDLLRNGIEIPPLTGIAEEAVEVLEHRVTDNNSLAITGIAEELQISKRTLQRHLQKQNMTFSALRSHVVLKYALECLSSEEMTIEEFLGFLNYPSANNVLNLALQRLIGSIKEYVSKNDKYNLSIDKKIEKIINCDSEDINELLDVAGLPRDLKLHEVDISNVEIESKEPIEIDFSNAYFSSKTIKYQGKTAASIDELVELQNKDTKKIR